MYIFITTNIKDILKIPYLTSHKFVNLYTYILTYIHIVLCVCVCVWYLQQLKSLENKS